VRGGEAASLSGHPRHPTASALRYIRYTSSHALVIKIAGEKWRAADADPFLKIKWDGLGKKALRTALAYLS
jgi:hypothetical protein